MHRQRPVILETAISILQLVAVQFHSRRRPLFVEEQFIMAEKCKLFGDLATRERILGVSDPRLHKRWGRAAKHFNKGVWKACLLYTSPSPRDATLSRMPSSA